MMLPNGTLVLYTDGGNNLALMRIGLILNNTLVSKSGRAMYCVKPLDSISSELISPSQILGELTLTTKEVVK